MRSVPGTKAYQKLGLSVKFLRRQLMRIGVIVRWSTRKPPVNGAGYDLWDGSAWLPITATEFNSLRARGLSIHFNPPWAGRG